MKTVKSHFTQTKKSYRKPILNKLGNVSKLTKGKISGSLDPESGAFNYSADA